MPGKTGRPGARLTSGHPSDGTGRAHTEYALPEQAADEFWKNLGPIENSFKPDALPEVHIPGAATDDDRYYAPFTETVGSRPLWTNVKDNSWSDVLRAKEAGLVNRHYHPYEVFASTPWSRTRAMSR
ncbi:hypothetical protein [Streptomyces sp. NRRL F-5755]|uniref:hypothetical protein n=1 Tax=Streptomyces sp. NRRL F-5755 TaxID=1519475 RepID=UPI001F3D8C55|nr:hypothetical protein [Streptomyces sp. NRRL F-5755]